MPLPANACAGFVFESQICFPIVARTQYLPVDIPSWPPHWHLVIRRRRLETSHAPQIVRTS